MKTFTSIALAASCMLAGAGAAAAQQAPQAPRPAYKRDVPARLLAQTKISEDSARAIALRQVPGGTVQALELEREGGTLIYSWDIKVAGKPGITEVHVSAIDGRVVAVEHEGD
jgi:uncharacterized membrane protein YkoI